MRWSIEARLAALQLAWLMAAATSAAILTRLFGDVVLATIVTVACGLVVSIVIAKHAARPVLRLLRAMAGAVGSYRDGDFSHSLVADRNDELGDLILAHNELAKAL